MKKCDVLFLNAYYDPEVTSDRHISSAITESMAQDGLTVCVRTPIPTRGITPQVRTEYRKHRRKETACDGKLLIHRFPLRREPSGFFRRTIRYFILDIKHFFACFRISARVLFVDSTPPLHGYFTRKISRLRKTPYVFFLQDVYPQAFVSANLLRESSRIYRMLLKMQAKVYRDAASILVISEDMKRDLIAEGFDAQKIELIRLWPDPSIRHLNREDNPLFDRFGLDRTKFYVVYGGNIGVPQNLELLVDCARMCAEQGEDIEFVVFGDGSQKERLRTYADSYELKNFHLFGMQPFDLVSAVYSLGNVAAVLCRKGTGSHNLPSKTWQIMASETPIVASYDRDSELSRTIEENSLGMACPAEDPKAFLNAVLSLKHDATLRDSMAHNCSDYVAEHNSRDLWTKKLNSIIRTVIEKKE